MSSREHNLQDIISTPQLLIVNTAAVAVINLLAVS
jgi:hypothetical protein